MKRKNRRKERANNLYLKIQELHAANWQFYTELGRMADAQRMLLIHERKRRKYLLEVIMGVCTMVFIGAAYEYNEIQETERKIGR